MTFDFGVKMGVRQHTIVYRGEQKGPHGLELTVMQFEADRDGPRPMVGISANGGALREVPDSIKSEVNTLLKKLGYKQEPLYL